MLFNTALYDATTLQHTDMLFLYITLVFHAIQHYSNATLHSTIPLRGYILQSSTLPLRHIQNLSLPHLAITKPYFTSARLSMTLLDLVQLFRYDNKLYDTKPLRLVTLLYISVAQQCHALLSRNLTLQLKTIQLQYGLFTVGVNF